MNKKDLEKVSLKLQKIKKDLKHLLSIAEDDKNKKKTQDKLNKDLSSKSKKKLK